jgi:hypothetical protein
MAVRSQLKSGYSFSLLFGTTVSVVGSLWLLSQPDRIRTDGLARIKAETTARVRHAYQIEWSDRTEATLFDGSLVEVPMQGTTSIVLDKEHSEILEPGSVVRITGTDGGPIRKEVVLRRDLASGGVNFRKQSDFGAALNLQISAVHLLTPVVDVAEDARYQQKLNHDLSRTYSRTLSMDYVLGNVGLPDLVPFGAFDDYSARPAYPPIGVLFKASQEENPCIGFVWSPIPIPGVNYVVEISKTFDFDYFRSFGSTKNFVRVKVNDPADYFWRIRAIKGEYNLVSEASRFSVQKPPLPPKEARHQAVIKRIREINASLMDLEFCN